MILFSFAVLEHNLHNVTYEALKQVGFAKNGEIFVADG
jgi:hypothetical protein